MTNRVFKTIKEAYFYYYTNMFPCYNSYYINTLYSMQFWVEIGVESDIQKGEWFKDNSNSNVIHETVKFISMRNWPLKTLVELAEDL